MMLKTSFDYLISALKLDFTLTFTKKRTKQARNETLPSTVILLAVGYRCEEQSDKSCLHLSKTPIIPPESEPFNQEIPLKIPLLS